LASLRDPGPESIPGAAVVLRREQVKQLARLPAEQQRRDITHPRHLLAASTI